MAIVNVQAPPGEFIVVSTVVSVSPNQWIAPWNHYGQAVDLAPQGYTIVGVALQPNDSLQIPIADVRADGRSLDIFTMGAYDVNVRAICAPV